MQQKLTINSLWQQNPVLSPAVTTTGRCVISHLIDRPKKGVVFGIFYGFTAIGAQHLHTLADKFCFFHNHHSVFSKISPSLLKKTHQYQKKTLDDFFKSMYDYLHGVRESEVVNRPEPKRKDSKHVIKHLFSFQDKKERYTMTDKKPAGRQASASTVALRSYLKANLKELFHDNVFTVSDLELALPTDKSATAGEDVKNLKVVLSNQLKVLAAEGVVALTAKPADAVSKKGKPANYYKLA